jgi:hypothetical protein
LAGCPGWEIRTQRCSLSLSLSNVRTGVQDYDENANTATLPVDYSLSEAAQTCGVEVYNPQGSSLGAAALPVASGDQSGTVDATGEPLLYVVLAAADTRAGEDKAHRNRPALERGAITGVSSARLRFYQVESTDPEVLTETYDPKYRWIIYFRETGTGFFPDGATAYITGTASGPGPVTDAIWNGQQNGNTGPVMPWGTYTFDIYVDEVEDVNDPNAPVLDETEFKTPYALNVADHSVEFAENSQGELCVKVRYLLQDSQDASEVNRGGAALEGMVAVARDDPLVPRLPHLRLAVAAGVGPVERGGDGVFAGPQRGAGTARKPGGDGPGGAAAGAGGVLRDRGGPGKLGNQGIRQLGNWATGQRSQGAGEQRSRGARERQGTRGQRSRGAKGGRKAGDPPEGGGRPRPSSLVPRPSSRLVAWCWVGPS